MTQKYWDMVNACESHEDIQKVQEIIANADAIDVDTFNDMMMALSFISRELYHQH